MSLKKFFKYLKKKHNGTDKKNMEFYVSDLDTANYPIKEEINLLITDKEIIVASLKNSKVPGID